MLTIIHQLKSFIQLYHWKMWFIILSLCSVSVYSYYFTPLRNFLDNLRGFNEFSSFFITYFVHYFFAFILIFFVFKKEKIQQTKLFLTIIILGFLIFSFRATVYIHGNLIETFSDEGQNRINKFVFNDIFRLLYLTIPVAVIWYFNDRKNQPLYGFSSKHHQTSLYWYLLLCMLPLLVFAGTQKEFTDYYPRFNVLKDMNPPSWKLMMYELCYGLDFFSIELFFRGFLILGMVKYIGIHSILPMAVFYMSIHFGKPMGETISSFFGGIILGVISYHSKSIYGGIMVHAGIAWLMELSGYIGNLFK